MTVGIILIAMVGAFLGLRLYSVLGRRTGHEQEPITGQVEDRRPTQFVLPRLQNEQQPETGQTAAPGPFARDAQRGLQSIATFDRSFDPAQFLNGAQRAYRMILEAFWKGDRDTLLELSSAEVAQDFIRAIEERDARGDVVENRLVRIEEARILAAELEGAVAHVTVRFDADIAAVTRDPAGTIVAGSLTDAVQTHDLWTFSRDTRSQDPEWRLTETDHA